MRNVYKIFLIIVTTIITFTTLTYCTTSDIIETNASNMEKSTTINETIDYSSLIFESEETTEIEEVIESTTVIEPVIPVPVNLIVYLNNNVRHYVGDTLTADDFTIIIQMSDDSTILNPNGWTIDNLILTDMYNNITITYENLIKTITVYAEPQTYTATITAIGDMLMHTPVSNRAFQADGTINYDYLFENTKDIFLNSDLSIVNNEVIFGGNERGLQNYPNFNVFTELGDAEYRAGFDVSLCATNHTMDQDVSGILNALNYWNNSPMTAIGIHNSVEEQNTVQYITINNIKIALFNFTYGLNGYSLPNEYSYLVDLMVDNNMTKIAYLLGEAEKNADFTIVFPHWGDEYQLHHNYEQERWAKYFIDYGADLIIGTHSHCLQDAEWITSNNGNVGFCYYSLGNYVSNQGYTYSLLGGIADIELIKKDNITTIDKINLIPTVTHYTNNYEQTFVYQLSQYTDELSANNYARFTGQYTVTQYSYPLSVETFYQLINDIGLTWMIYDEM